MMPDAGSTNNDPRAPLPPPRPATLPPATLPAGWHEATDPASGQTYYYNHDLHQSQLEHPATKRQKRVDQRSPLPPPIVGFPAASASPPIVVGDPSTASASTPGFDGPHTALGAMPSSNVLGQSSMACLSVASSSLSAVDPEWDIVNYPPSQYILKYGSDTKPSHYEDITDSSITYEWEEP